MQNADIVIFNRNVKIWKAPALRLFSVSMVNTQFCRFLHCCITRGPSVSLKFSRHTILSLSSLLSSDPTTITIIYYWSCVVTSCVLVSNYCLILWPVVCSNRMVTESRLVYRVLRSSNRGDSTSQATAQVFNRNI